MGLAGRRRGVRRTSAQLLNWRQLGVLLLGVAGISTGAILLRLADDVAPLAKASWRLTLATVVLIPLVGLHRPWRRELFQLFRDDTGRVVAAGTALALHFGLWVPSVDYTTVASSVILVTMSPLFVGLMAPRLIGETVGAALRTGVAIATVGAVVIGWGDMAFGPRALLGDVLALGGALAAAAYFLSGRTLRHRVGLLPYVTAVYGIAALMLLTVALISGQTMTGYPAIDWMWLLAMALVPQLLGHTAFNWALAGLSATFVAVSTLGEPIGSTLLAWWILDEPPTLQTVVGGALIFAGLLTATLGERRRAFSVSSDRPT